MSVNTLLFADVGLTAITNIDLALGANKPFMLSPSYTFSFKTLITSIEKCLGSSPWTGIDE